jgi:hypothetical protein
MEGRARKQSEFKVVLGGIELTEEQERSLSSAIQGAVAGHLAELDLGGDDRAGVLEIGGRFGGWAGGKWLVLEPGERDQLQAMFERG